MLSSFLLILLGTAAVATPLSSSNDNEATIVERGDQEWWLKRSDLPARIKRCNNSPNCESYINSLGDWDMRFKRGMEPGSADYQRRFAGLSKRESSNVTTYLEIYDHSLTWGCDIHPAVTLGNLSIMCPKGEASCIGGPVNIPIQWMTPAPGEAGREPIPETMAITATGSYDPEFQGDFIQAIQAVAAAGAKWDLGQEWQASVSKTKKQKQRRDTGPEDDPGSSMNKGGSCDLATLTSAINLDRFISGNDNVQGFMHVSITIPTLQSGFCAVTGDLGAASAIGGAIPGIGGVVGGIFGLISAACSLSNSAKVPAGQ